MNILLVGVEPMTTGRVTALRVTLGEEIVVVVVAEEEVVVEEVEIRTCAVTAATRWATMPQTAPCPCDADACMEIRQLINVLLVGVEQMTIGPVNAQRATTGVNNVVVAVRIHAATVVMRWVTSPHTARQRPKCHNHL